MKFYHQLTQEEKRKLRAMVEDIDRLRKQQIALFEELIIAPLQDARKAGKAVLGNRFQGGEVEISIERYLAVQFAVSQRIAQIGLSLKNDNKRFKNNTSTLSTALKKSDKK